MNLMNGFLVLGLLPEVDYGCKPMAEAKRHMVSRSWVEEIRVQNNHKVLGKVRESEWSEDVWNQTVEDANLDRMTWPVESTDDHILHMTMCRQIAVR